MVHLINLLVASKMHYADSFAAQFDYLKSIQIAYLAQGTYSLSKIPHFSF